MTIWERDKPALMGRPSGLAAEIKENARRSVQLEAPRGLARLLPENVRRRIVEAMGGGTLLGQVGSAGDEDLQGYRPLGQRIDSITRDLDAWTYDKQIRMALYLYATNPMAAWLVENLVDVTLGEELGFTVHIDPEKAGFDQKRADAVQDEIEKHLEIFWTHPAHSLDTRAEEYATTFLVTGALLLPAIVNSVDGVPMLDIIDAQQISKVVSADKSAMVPGQVWYRGAADGAESKPINVIRQRERQGALITTADLAGDPMAFYFPNRKLLNQLMGTSFLMDVIDWLDRHDNFMFAALDRAKFTNNLIWHLRMKGFTQEQCDAEARKHKRQATFNNPGSLVVTNEESELEAVSPKLEAGDVDTMARTFRTHILGAKNRPESWYSAGGETNRATAQDQTDVSLKCMKRWQKRFRGMFELMLWFAVDAGKAAQPEARKAWPSRESGALSITLTMPNVKDRDYKLVGEALQSIEAGLNAAVDDEMLSKDTARRVFLMVASKLGAELDPAKEIDKIEQESEARDEQDMEQANARARELLARGVPEAPAKPPKPPAPGAAPTPEPEAAPAA